MISWDCWLGNVTGHISISEKNVHIQKGAIKKTRKRICEVFIVKVENNTE